MSNNIETLRAHLFDTLAALKDQTNPMDIDRAKVVSEVAQVIINSAKVEVDFARATGKSGSQFLNLEVADGSPPIPPPTSSAGLPPGITKITRHIMKG